MKYKDIKNLDGKIVRRRQSVPNCFTGLIRFHGNFEDVLLDIYFSKYFKNIKYDIIRSYDFNQSSWVYYTMKYEDALRVPLINYIVKDTKIIDKNLTKEEKELKSKFIEEFNIQKLQEEM